MKNKLIKLSIFILFICLILIVTSLLLDLGFKLISFNGISMCPSYGKSGYGLHKAISSTDDLRIGNVYLFENLGYNYTYVEHRLIEINKNYYVFKGDNNNYVEKVPFSKVKYENIIHILFEEC